MIQLKPDECRVLGVLVEKAMTTPAQYPLSLNGLTLGCNQKSNRFPVVEWDDDRALDAVDSLRAKRLVSEVQFAGSRVAKFKHNAREVLAVDTAQLVVLTELLLRGPQSIGDIRSNASRMHALESMETARVVLDSLMAPARPEPLIKEIPPPPGGRARLFVQLLCSDLHPLSSLAPASAGPHAPQLAEPHTLAVRVEDLESKVAALRAAIGTLAAKLGEPDPLA